MGRRRIDRVLAPDYLDELSTSSLVELRGLRDDAEQEETDLSYLRRLLQGRIDILGAELSRRAAGDSGEDLVAALSRILADRERPGPRGLGRHLVVGPSTPAERRRAPETLVGDVGFDDPRARSDKELTAALAVLEEEEHRQSGQRQAVQRVVDTCSAEIVRRYRAGEASVSDLLNPDRPARKR